MLKPYLGVWVDHREVYLIWADEDGRTELRHADAHYPEKAKKSYQATSGGGAFGGVAPHATLAEKQKREARRFYERVFKAIRNAENVYIFGPGQARKELLRRLQEHKDFNGRVRGVEGAERMSEAQMAARVRRFFGLPDVPGREVA